MATGDADAVRRFLELARDTPDSVWGIFDDDVEWVLSVNRAPDFPTVSRGPEAVREFFRRWSGTFEDWDYAVEDMVEGPGTVAVRIHQWGRGKGSGAEVDSRFWQIWVMRDGRAVRVIHDIDRSAALEAAGVSS